VLTATVPVLVGADSAGGVAPPIGFVDCVTISGKIVTAYFGYSNSGGRALKQELA